MLLLLLAVLSIAACSRKPDAQGTPAATAPPAALTPASTILPDGCSDVSFLRAQLRGALDADLYWQASSQMRCEGGPRPGGKGLRVSLAGPLPLSAAPYKQLRFIFGIANRDIAPGAAQALPTNVTVILEGNGQMFATRGDEHCAVERLEREALTGRPHQQRVRVSGYCLDPATSMSGDARLLIPTFEFSGVVNAGDEP